MKYRLAGLMALVLFAMFSLLFLPFTSDDAFITLRFARHLSQGLGPCFNPGEMSYGFTSPLWVLLLALFSRLGVDLLWGAKALSLLSGAGGVILFFILSRGLLKNYFWILLGLLAWATDPWLLRWSPSGMESSLAAALVLLAFLVFKRETDSEGGFILTGSSLGLAFLARPECAGLALAAGIVLGVKRDWKALGGLLLGFLVLALPWLLYAQVTFHHLLPNTFSAKAGLPAWQDSVRAFFRTVRIVGPTYFLELLGFLAAGVYLIGNKALGKVVRQNLLLLLWVLGLPLLYVLGGVGVQSRYLLLITPLVVLYGLSSWERVVGGWKRTSQSVALAAGCLLVLTTNLGMTFALNLPMSLRFSQGVEQCLIPMGRYLKENTPLKSSVALVDIGAVGYYSERRVVDLGGLIHPGLLPLIVRYPREGILPYLPGAGYGKPEYFITRSTRSGLEAFKGLKPVLTKEFGPLGVSDLHSVWTYTLYRVDWDSFGSGSSPTPGGASP